MIALKVNHSCGALTAALLASSVLITAPARGQASSSTSPLPTVVPQQSSSDVSPANSAPKAGVEEIIVTAQKREQNLQKVPISITALTQSSLVANRIADVRDLSALAPNLTIRVSSGGSGSPNYSMRGVVTSGTAPGTDKGVSVYLDGVYLQNVQGSVFELADVDRIEVLKGPQGTLFGRNATGGAISIITHNPTGNFDVRQEFTYGNYNQFRSKTRVDLPTIGPFAASVAYLHSERRGDTRNLGAGTQWDYGPATGGKIGALTSPEYLGDENINSVFATVQMNAIDHLNLTYKFDYSENHYTPEAQGAAAANFGVLGPATGGLLSAMLAYQPDPSKLTQFTTSRPDAVNNAFTTPSFTRNMGQNFTARYAFNSAISIKNILAFRSTFNSTTYQLDGLGGLLNVVSPAIGPIGSPFLILANSSETSERQWSNETQLNITTRGFEVTAGLIHFHDHDSTGGFPGAPNIYTFQTAPNYVIPGNGSRLTDVTVDSDAVYVQPELHLTDRLDLVGGIRLTHDKKQIADNTSTSLGTINYKYSNRQPTYLASINYNLTKNILTYAKYSTGYISGGFLATLTFAPEKSESFEVGAKADLLDRKLRLNLALFDVNYTGLQYTTAGITVGIPAAPQVVINGGNAKARGFEFEATAVPIDGLTLAGGVGYTDFWYTSVSPLLGTIESYLPINRPKVTANGSIEYRTPEVLDGGHLVLRTDFNYKSKTFLAYNVPAALLPLTTTTGTLIVNGRVALADFRLAGTNAQLALWARNIADNRQYANMSSYGFLFSGSFERARTFGIDLNVDFR